MEEYLVVSFYKFVPIAIPQQEVADHHFFAKGRDLTGRIYLAPEGINAQFSGASKDVQAYIAFVEERLGTLDVKIQRSSEHVFPRMTIKARKQLVALDQEVDMQKTGTYVNSQQWRSMLESGEYLLLDVRNDYEWEVGRFKGSQKPLCNTFREFPEAARQLKQDVDPKSIKVMMCCTGGIRCELFSALLKEEGFEEVYQLHGGILRYAEEEKGKHWEGKLFVFDDRLAVPVNEEEETVVGRCHWCASPADHYYNCANMDCNTLFLCCDSCLEAHLGCCQEACGEGHRLRPVERRPFRRWYNYLEAK